ncbi:glycosyltransferase family 4 protein [Pseudomonas sp. LRF_L74]|uniref:glycosyltransferase family 4 protein n=1 Tax=Pseudomonas sp. LRF_L74 TaxID=3369422 RepID=UPI003F5EFB3F
MKIFLIGTTFSSMLGFRRDLIISLLKRGHEVFVCCTDYEGEQKEVIKALGAVPVAYRLSRSGINPLSDLIAAFSLYGKIKAVGPDVVFSFFSKPVVWGTLAAVLARVPRRVAMLEGLGYAFTRKPEGDSLKIKALRFAQVQLYRISFPFLSDLILLNGDDKADLLDRFSLSAKSVSILGGIGVDLQVHAYSSPVIDPVSFIFIGRLLREKGVYEFTEAAAFVKGKYPESEFLIVGGLDRENPGALSENQLDELVRKGIVRYVGHVNDVTPLIRDSSVFVLPSYREGLPRSTQEAMAIGLPVITSDVPGCRDTVVDGYNGFIVPPWSASEVANKMIHFIENPGLILAMGLNSRKLAEEKYDVSRVNKHLIQLITGMHDA